jgi:hypothetical protein
MKLEETVKKGGVKRVLEGLNRQSPADGGTAPSVISTRMRREQI